MRIDVVTVITGLSSEALEQRRRALARLASPGIETRLVVVSNGPASVESEAELLLAAPGILRAVVESAADGADGIVIWGGHDPALEAARELVDVPVIAPGMASMLLACSVAHRFGLLVQLEQVRRLAERQVDSLGLAARCAGVYSVETPVLELAGEAAYASVERAALDAVDAGADAVCFGCMAMAPHANRLQERLAARRPGALVIDPGSAAIRWLELLIGMGLCHSRRSHPAPPKPISLGQ